MFNIQSHSLAHSTKFPHHLKSLTHSYQLKAFIFFGKKFNFPIVIFDGPGKNIGFDLSASIIKVAADKLEIKSFDEDSRCFDHFTVDKQGKLNEIDNPYKKSILKKYEFWFAGYRSMNNLLNGLYG